MNRVIEDLAFGAIGYAVGTKRKSDDCTNVSIEEYIERYAISHGIYLKDDNFADDLRRIADTYSN